MPSADSVFNPPSFYDGALANPNYKAPAPENKPGFTSADPNTNTNPNFPSNTGTSNISNVTPVVSSGRHRHSSSVQPTAVQEQSRAPETVVFSPEQVEAQRLANERAANEQQIKDYYAKQAPGTYQYVTDSRGLGYSMDPSLLNKPDVVDSRGNGYSMAPSVVEEQQKQARVTEFFAPKFVDKGPSTSKFERAAEAQRSRQERFENSPGFERVRGMANFLTFGRGAAYDERSFVGKMSENIVFGTMAGPIQLGESIVMAGEKLYLTGRYVIDPKFSNSQESFSQRLQDVGSEYKRAGQETVSTAFNPTTPEGASTYAGAAIFAFVPAAEKFVSSRNNVLFKEFKNVEQTGSDVLYTRSVERASEARYIESNVLPNADFIASEIVKSKSAQVSTNPQEVLLKFNLEDNGRSGTRSIVQDLNTGKVSIVDRIQAENAIFSNGKGDFIRTIESTEKPGVYDVKVYNTNDYLSSEKPFIERTFVDKSAQFTIGNSKAVNDLMQLQGKNGAMQEGSIVLTRDVVYGDFLQTTKYSVDVTQTAKLDRPYVVFSDKELVNIYNSKGSYIGVKEDYYSQKAFVEFGNAELYPNSIMRNGGRVSEIKFPQTSSSTFVVRDLDISMRRLTAEESKAFVQKNLFEEKSYLGGRLKVYKNLDMFPDAKNTGYYAKEYFRLSKEMRALRSSEDTVPFYNLKQQRYGVVDSFIKGFGGMKTELVAPETVSIKINSASLDMNANIRSFDIRISRLDSSSGNILQFIPGTQHRASRVPSARIGPSFRTSFGQFYNNEFRAKSREDINIAPDVVSKQSNSMRQSNNVRFDIRQEQKSVQSRIQAMVRGMSRSARSSFKMPKTGIFVFPLPARLRNHDSPKPGKLRPKEKNLGFKVKAKNYQRYILPSLRAVNITEWTGVEAKAPRATRKIVNQAYAQMRGYDLTSIIPTEQMRVRRVKT